MVPACRRPVDLIVDCRGYIHKCVARLGKFTSAVKTTQVIQYVSTASLMCLLVSGKVYLPNKCRVKTKSEKHS